MRLFLLLSAIFIAQYANSQSQYYVGFNTGFAKGYCFDQGPGCVAPVTPVSPILKPGEDIDNYNDGYNRGFSIGRDAQEQDSKIHYYSRRSSSTTTSNGVSTSSPKSSGFRTAKATFVENKMSNPWENLDMNDLMAVANVLKQMKGRALSHLEDGEPSEAIRIASAGYEINNIDVEFWMILAQGYRDLGQRKSALRWYKKVARQPGYSGLRDFINKYENGLTN